MDYDFLYNLKLKDSGFQSKLGSNFSSRHKNTFMAEYKQSLSAQKRKFVVKKNFAFPSKSLLHTPTNASLALNHYQSLTSFKEKLSVPCSPIQSKHSKQSSQDFSRTPDLNTTLSFQSILKASEILRKHGLKQCTLSYKRQLKEFCQEFLSKYNNSN